MFRRLGQDRHLRQADPSPDSGGENDVSNKVFFSAINIPGIVFSVCENEYKCSIYAPNFCIKCFKVLAVEFFYP